MPAEYRTGRSGRGGRWSDELLDEIRAKTDIASVIGEYVQLKKRGANFLGLCPFHQEKTPSFTVSPDRQMFYCFGCQTGGNIFSFLMKRESLSFAEAVEQLAARAGVTLPERASTSESPAARAADERRKRETDLLYRVLDFASRYYGQVLLKSPAGEKARTYLSRRGIKPESVGSFRLGYSLDSWTALVKILTAKGVDETVLERAGLALRGREGQGHYDRFRSRLMFTISDHRGRPIGFGARALKDGDEPKYLNSPETPLFSKGRGLYALHLAAQAIRRRGLAIVVEGYMDAIACHERGFDFTVASMGTAFTPDQARLLRRLTDTVVTAFDADAAGTQATLRGLEVLTAAGFKVRVAEMPGGKDPDECLRADGGPEAFGQAVDGAVPLPEYRFRLALRRHDTATIEGRVDVVNEILPVLAGIVDTLELGQLMRSFAERLRVPEAALHAELGRYRTSQKRNGASQGGIRASIRTARRAAESPISVRQQLELEAGPVPRHVRDAERALLSYMVGPEDGLHLVLTRLLDATDWCRKVGLDPVAAGREAAAWAASAADPGVASAKPEATADPGIALAEAEAAATAETGLSAAEVASAPEVAPAAGIAPASAEDGTAGDRETWDPEDDGGAWASEDGGVDLDDLAGSAASLAGETGSPAGDLAEPLTDSESAVLDWFGDPTHRRIARAVLLLARDGAIDAARLIDHLAEAGPGDGGSVGGGHGGAAAGDGEGEGDRSHGSGDASRVVARVFFELQTLSDQPAQAIADCLGVLKEHRLNSRIEQLHRRIEDLERRGTQVEREYAELIRELIDLERHTDGGTGHWKVPGD